MAPVQDADDKKQDLYNYCPPNALGMLVLWYTQPSGAVGKQWKLQEQWPGDPPLSSHGPKQVDDASFLSQAVLVIAAMQECSADLQKQGEHVCYPILRQESNGKGQVILLSNLLSLIQKHVSRCHRCCVSVADALFLLLMLCYCYRCSVTVVMLFYYYWCPATITDALSLLLMRTQEC